MKRTTLKALKESIKHWEENVLSNTAESTSVSGEDCALCNSFVLKTGSCIGCPIYEFSTETECNGTPYYDARFARNKWIKSDTNKNHIAFKKAAIEEYEFLVSLLPNKY